MQDARSCSVALFDRRKGYGERTLDRRRTYVDVMERVLGNDALARARQHNRFERQITGAGATVGTAITGIEVHLLDGSDDKR
jgi:hypothetical protein